ncbi:MAG TPA: phage tail sheath subtilisin-like domain-containing protein [Longimicrobium sp.]|nr:phage tail sheath subtilisin-like domain-containing protein [Longimicrobium sp.]
MPEYLAPGVYVEETSFRAKSIEGVSTSTTAFVGPTRRGPTTGTPELVTSYADFERIYGGLGPVLGEENYLAHGVQAYFNEGGARLYVSRVFAAPNAGDGRARSAELAGGGRFVARFPGSGGNGTVTLRKIYQGATAATMARAPEGTFLRTGGERPAEPARISSSVGGPFSVQDGETLVLTVDGGTPATVTFKGKAASVTGTKINDPLNLADNTEAERTLTVTVNGTPRVVVLDARSWPLAELAEHLASRIPDVTVTVDGGKLTITTRRTGSGASLSAVGGPFGFAGAGKTSAPQAPADNTVPDLRQVGVGDLDAALRAVGARAGVREGKLEISTATAGETSTLSVGAGTANAALGLVATEEGKAAVGKKGPARRWFRREGGSWLGAGAGESLNPDVASQMEGGADFVFLLVETEDADGVRLSYEGLALGEAHPRFLGNALSETPSRRSDFLEQAFAFTGSGFTAHQLHDALFGEAEEARVGLADGNDGAGPTTLAYQRALEQLLPLEDISILAAPGHTAYDGWEGIQGALISHAERPRAYQIAVLDTQSGQAISGARETRSRIDSKYAALYYPWVTVPNPAWRPGRDDLAREIDLPPSGFLAGIYARNDVQRGVHKAPANEVVRGALRFESDVNFDEQGVLNPQGVNCLRFFPGRGFRVWGARTVSSDPEWKYVSVRRYFNYVERSIDVGTQWAVFEPNGEALWANVRQTIASFLYNEWRNGALLGTDPKQAYFVRCDRSTMTQNDLDNGRLVCLVGVAVVKPAEFVIFRIGQKTADARD